MTMTVWATAPEPPSLPEWQLAAAISQVPREYRESVCQKALIFVAGMAAVLSDSATGQRESA